MMPVATTARFFLLDAVASWRGVLRSLAERPGDRALVIDAIPGTVQAPFTPGEATCPPSDSLRCPVAIAADPCAGVIAYDSTVCGIVRIDERTGLTEVLEGVGGCGDEPRRFSHPRALAMLADGSFAVAEPDAHRVQVFTAAPFLLANVIEPGPASQPVGVAAAPRGNLYVLDAAAGEVLEISLVSGATLRRIGAGALSGGSAIAAATDGTVAVLAGSRLAVFPAGADTPRWLDLPAGFTFAALAADSAGSVYAGALPIGAWEGGTLRIGLSPDPHVVGFGPLGITGRIVSLAFTPRSNLLALVYSPQSRATTLWTIDPRGASLESGVFESDVFDSRVDRCSWDRLDIEGSLPSGARLAFESVTADTAAGCVFPARTEPLVWSNPTPTTLDDPEFLVQTGPGRYLRFRVTVASSGGASPAIRAFRLRYPRQSYLQYLPAVFQEDPDSRSFLDRFLSLVQRSFDGFDRQIDRLWTLADPRAIPTEYLQWLAALVALPIDPTWPDDKRREVLARVFVGGGDELSGDYPHRGTRAGLEQSIRDYAGIDDVGILEHFRLRDWLRDGTSRQLCADRVWSRDIYQRLQVDAYSRLGYFRLIDRPEPALEPFDWGAHRFSVFFRADPYTVDDTERRVRQVVERDKPAHTEAVYCPVFPRFRVEYQATVGIDTALGEVHEMVLDRLATLDYDAVLGCGGRAAGDPLVSTLPRAGVSTQLL